MINLSQVKRVVFVGTANMYFRNIASNKIYPFLHNEIWVISTDIEEMGRIKELDSITLTIKEHSFYYQIKDGYLFIQPA